MVEDKKDPQTKDRRTEEERRSGVDRRKLNPSRYTGIEKRFDKDCRTSQDRRDDGKPWLEYQSPEIKK